jgi:hypothetical protein
MAAQLAASQEGLSSMSEQVNESVLALLNDNFQKPVRLRDRFSSHTEPI